MQRKRGLLRILVSRKNMFPDVLMFSVSIVFIKRVKVNMPEAFLVT
jgi:hypothetical protein